MLSISATNESPRFSTTLLTASTAILAKCSVAPPRLFPCIAVMATFLSVSRSFKSTGFEISLRISLAEQQLRPLEKFAREHHRSGCPIAHFIVLGLCDLDKHLCSRMLHV